MNIELCDEEKSYNDWVANNLDYINQHKIHISVMKKLYMAGYAAGFDSYKNFQTEEQ
jgi:hypothetical protein